MRFAALAFVTLALAQDQPTGQLPPGLPGVGQAQGSQAAAPALAVLEYSGKPMLLPFQCTEDDVQWGGLTCSEQEPCPIYLELSAVEAVGSHLFAAGNIHSPSVTLYSAAVRSDDGGRTWREIGERIRGAELDHIQFLDPETGWISGGIQFPLPRDPFLLVTADGGQSWQQRPVFSEDADDHFGAIQQFFFGSRASGSLVIDRGRGAAGDRYEMYESQNLGESWSFRESSGKPLRLRMAAPPAEWRLRADAVSHAFHIEHRIGERWNTAAAFAVKLGACGARAGQ